MICKHCSTEVSYTVGLRDFCSPECRDEYRRIYLRFKAQKRRESEKMKECIDPSKIYKTNPCVSTIYDMQHDESEKIYEGFGKKAWYSLAKKECCNFEVRVKEGYCVTLSEPYQGFKCKCSDCSLGQALMNKAKEDKKKELKKNK